MVSGFVATVASKIRGDFLWLSIQQVDTYGLLGTIHSLIFLDYMKVFKGEKGRWEITKSFKRYVYCQ